MKPQFQEDIIEFTLINPHKKNHTDKALELIANYDDNTPFLRTCFNDGHFTGSMLVINKKRTQILLMHHIKLGTWQQFGGHADGDTNLRNVAIRELEEESGILETNADIGKDIFYLDRHKVYAHNGEPDHFHYDVGFLAVVDENIKFLPEESEVHDIQWFDIEKVRKELNSGKYSSGLCKMLESL